MRLLLLVPGLLLTLFLGGCWHVSKTPPPTTPPTTTGTTKLTTTTTSIDTSDWQTYTNKEYGFSFRYPREWGYVRFGDQLFGSFIQVGENEKRYLAVTITNFAKSPLETIDYSEDGVTWSKDNLIKHKKFIQKNSTSKNNSGFFIEDPRDHKVGYDYVGGGFTLIIDSFVDNNLIRFQKGLYRVIDYDQYFDDFGHIKREFVNKKLKELNAGIGSPEELAQVALFDAIINTLKPIRPLSN